MNAPITVLTSRRFRLLSSAALVALLGVVLLQQPFASGARSLLTGRTLPLSQAVPAAKPPSADPAGSMTAAEKDKLAAALKKNAETLHFIENKGQWAPEVLYGFSTTAGQVYVLRDRLVFEVVHKAKGPEDAEDMEVGHVSHTFSMVYDGANAKTTIQPAESFVTTYNYFHGDDPSKWAADVRAFKELTLAEVYPGISLRLYSEQNATLEYDWLVSPGADFSDVQLRIEDADGVSVKADGSLDVNLRFGPVNFSPPHAYQVTDKGNEVIPFSFAETAENEVTFTTAKTIDPQYPLVIDPTVLWGTWYDQNSSSFDEYLYATAIDPATNYIYCAGIVNVTHAALSLIHI